MQLRSFAWVKVRPEVKAKVAAQTRREELRAAKTTAAKRESVASDGFSPGTRRGLSDEENNSDPAGSRSNSIAGLLSPALKPVSPALKPASDTASISSGRTALHVSAPSPALRPSPLSNVENHLLSPLSGDKTEDTALSVPPLDLTDVEESLIVSPHRATAEESRWLTEIGESLSDEELREHWSSLYRYFDGRWALEDIAAREGMKRSKAAGLLNRLEKEGVLCVVRHW